MKNVVIRIALWASAGFLMSAGWGLYFANANKSSAIQPATYTLAKLTQPIMWVLSPASPLSLNLIVLANAATFALLGFILETIREHRRLPHISD